MKNYIKYLILALTLIIGAGAGLYLYKYKFSSTTGIFEYDPKIDREFILKTFKDNWHWLVSEYSTDFDQYLMLDKPDIFAKKRDVTNMHIMVYRVDNKPVAFSVYYVRPILRGDILFLAVDEAHRKHGYGRKLIQYDLDQLKKMGCFVVKITTRVTNTPARKLYESFGFKELWTERGFVKYELNT